MVVSSSHTHLPVDDLTLDVENPRIQLIMERYKGEITAEIIHLALGSGRTRGIQAIAARRFTA